MSAKPRVLIIYTGGTIGMIKDPQTGELTSFDFHHILDHVPELRRFDVALETRSLEPPIDSSEMQPARWTQLAQLIHDCYHSYDGFVVLHGSDTMAFTASALSFQLQGIRKPIVFTGSQLPIGTIRTDGKENLITAIEIAAQRQQDGSAVVQEVAVYFEYSLYRGNRSSKISANQFEAFDSPNYPELAVAGVDINYNHSQLYRTSRKDVAFFPELNERVALLKIHPGFPVHAYAGLFDRTHTDAVVLETFGSGNAPSDKTFQHLLLTYMEAGGIVLNTTQCSSGAVEQGKYATSSFFQQSGVISGNDLTTEAALAKLMHLLAHHSDTKEIRAALKQDLCGEMTIG
jgi:L-asparaginase